jgi:hypothetical protein
VRKKTSRISTRAKSNILMLLRLIS